MASDHHKKIHQTQANLQSGKPCFPKGAQFGTANDESPGFAELLLGGTKNLNYFRPYFSHLLPGCVWHSRLRESSWDGLGSSSSLFQPQLECFTAAFPFGDISLDS